MNKLFKTSLVAAAVAGTFAVNAATLSPTVLEFSSQGVAANLTEDATALVVTVILDEEHTAGSTITLDFGSTAELADMDLTAAGDGLDFTDVVFDVGNGSFTFTDVAVLDNDQGIEFTVDLGDSVTAGSSFEVTISDSAADGSDLILSGAGSVTMSSVNIADEALDSGTAVWATEESQYTIVLNTEFDNTIERESQVTFTSFDAPNEGDNTEDFASFTLTDDTTLLAAVTTVSYDVTVEGSFGGLLAADFTADSDGGLAAAPADAVNAGADEYTFTISAADANYVASDTYEILFDLATATTIPESDFELTVEADYTLATATVADNADLGEWELDASVVNVPYLPVGFDSLSANVEYSNHGNAVAEVIIEAFDDEGNTYTGTLANAAAETVTKYSDADIMDALGITESTKLNITFISDADADEVSIVPYYRQGDSRVQSINDQYKGDEVR